MDEKFRLTTEERKLVNKNLDFYVSLSSGKRKPQTEEQRHFVRVCKCKTKANTVHELAFIKYRMKEIAMKNVEKKESEQGVRQFEPGHPDSSWFTNDDWKKLHPDRSRH